MELLDERRRIPRIRLERKLPATAPYLTRAHATQVGLERDVEVRILPGGLAGGSSDRFFAELRDLTKLDHPGFLPVLGDMSVKGRPCYLVSLRDHETLAELVGKDDFDLEARCQAVRTLADAMDAAHAEAIPLGPVPPERIAWDPKGRRAYFLHHRAVPGDWSAERLRHTPLAGEVPERTSTRDDVFAWGLLAFWILTRGQHPYGAGPEDLRALRGIEPKVRHELARVIETALAWEPELRPASGLELRAVLDLDPRNLADVAEPADERVDIRKISSEVLELVEVIRESGEFDRPRRRSRRSDDALEDERALIGEGGSPEDWVDSAERYGMWPRFRRGRPGEASGWGFGRWVILALIAGVAGVAYRRSQVSSGSVQLPPAAASRKARPTTRKTRGPVDPRLRALLSRQGDVLREDFEGIYSKLQQLIIERELPDGENDGPRLMRLYLRFRRQPEAACRELQSWMDRLRAKARPSVGKNKPSGR